MDIDYYLQYCYNIINMKGAVKPLHINDICRRDGRHHDDRRAGNDARDHAEDGAQYNCLKKPWLQTISLC